VLAEGGRCYSTRLQSFYSRARICKPFKEPRNRFPAWQPGRQPYLSYRPAMLHIGWRNRFHGIDSWVPQTFTNTASELIFKDDENGFSPLRIVALCHPYSFLLHSPIVMNRVTMDATISKRRNSGYCMYILYGFSAGTFVLVTENQVYCKVRPPTSNSKNSGH
jgi:hypothetical protein